LDLSNILAKVPYGYAANCQKQPITTYASLVPHGLQFHADIIKVHGKQAIGDVKLSNENQDLEVSISGNCAYTAYGETHFQKLGSFLPQLLMPIGCCWSSIQDYYQSFN